MQQTQVIPADAEWINRDIRDFEGAPARRIGDDWMLITAGDTKAEKGNWNTISWGGLGVLWRFNVAFMFIRPPRRTFDFANSAALFTLSFFDSSFHKALELCGTKSGRDRDKAAATGLTPIEFADGTIAFREASDIITCRKLYTHDFDPAAFLDPSIDEACYPQKDYHRMYIGEVVAVKSRV
jgi:flavin reductase (DIM6/NTAB) family NADH-FMN oxidoreductase RutF